MKDHIGIDVLLLVGLVEVVSDVTTELREQERGALFTTTLVADRVFYLNFIKNGTVVEFDEERVANGTLLGVVIIDAEALVFDAEGLGAENVDAGVGCRSVGAVLIGRSAMKRWKQEGQCTD